MGDDLYNCDATYSCIENGDDGEGNINQDPLWANGPLGNFYLSQLVGGQTQTEPMCKCRRTIRSGRRSRIRITSDR